MWKTIIIAVVALVIGVVGTLAITQRYYTKQIDRLSIQLNIIRDTNQKLSIANTELTELNTGNQKRIGELEKRIVDDNNYYQGKLGKIGGSLIGIAEDLGGTATGLRDIIEGIEQIKELIKDL